MSGYVLREIPEQLADGWNKTGSTLARGVAVMTDSTDPTSYPERMKLPTATTSSLRGICRADVVDGAIGPLLKRGRAIAKAGGAITVGADVYVTTAGKFIVTAPASGVNGTKGGVAMTAAAADNDLFELDFAPELVQGQ